ncbi:hypothetical protein ANO14919_003240 [Xylariales sp. No.14919]|nr:hypothetical protein ANO14919_003240 [Xylariales sp. No.14919]
MTVLLQFATILVAIVIIIYTALVIAAILRDSACCGTIKQHENCQLLAFCYGPCSAGPKKPACDKKRGIQSQDAACRENCVCREVCS